MGSHTPPSLHRQCCPLSPLLFAVAMDILLRRLQRLCPSSVERAFADDTAMTLASVPRDGPVVSNIFREFAAISGMHLNNAKCVFIPLWQTTVADAAASLASWVPSWANFTVRFWGKYLGFAVGPAGRQRGGPEPSRHRNHVRPQGRRWPSPLRRRR